MTLDWVVIVLVAGCSVVLEKTQALNVSERCMQDTEAFLWEINQDRPKQYAVQMYDAFGKIGSDVYGGNINRPGSLQECQSARGPTFSGQYCRVSLKQDMVNYFVGICVPDSCGKEDVQMLVAHGQFQLGQTSLIPPFPPSLVPQSSQAIIMISCLSSTTTADASAIICLFVCCVMVAIPLVATLFTAITTWKRHREVSPRAESASLNTGLNLYGTLMPNGSSSGGNNSYAVQQQSEMGQNNSEEDNKSTRPTPLCFLRSCGYQCLQAFSLQTTSQGVLSTSSSIAGASYSSLNGIRALSLLWIISGHSAILPAFSSLDNFNTWKKTVEDNPLYLFTDSGPIYVSVDTFLLLGGLLSARSLLSSIRRAEDKMSPSLVASFLFKRLKRVQPLHLFIVCLVMSVFSVARQGAYGFIFEDEVEDCKMFWWANILLINNLYVAHKMCVPWAWYLSLDFQCYLTTPLLVYLFRRNRVLLAAVAASLLLIISMVSAVLTALLQIPVHQPTSLSYKNYFIYYYYKPYSRYGPYLIGILMGIYMTTKKDQFIKHQWQAALGWFSCMLSLALVVGLAYVLREVPPHPSVPHALYQGLHRSLWALAVAWIILACEEGYGGFIKRLLSLGLWVPISNISFACYMVHPILINYYNGKQETPVHYTDINFMYLFSGHLAVSLVAGYVLTVLVEKPFLLLKGSSGWRQVSPHSRT
ncbi:O-acyltransferase like protein [Centroberyx affinis]|uniref:O-acyltransferase like protein n=1 Tax=Centroberyx affinis TaxID=166261 RepID=UPI003A5C0C20